MIHFSNIKKIGVCAPSSYVEKEDIEAAKALIESKGYDVFIHPQSYVRTGQIAGSVAERVAALHELYADPEVDVVWAAGGGNRALELVDALDYDLIKANPKPLIGFSDVTALLNAIAVRTDIPTIHGPVFKNLPKYKELDVLLAGNFDIPLENAIIINKGRAAGRLFGGNLSVFQYLPQTLPNFTKGAILFLEDCNEELSRIDRMFLHLKRIGVLNEIAGLILGEFTDLQDSARPFGFTLEEVVREHTAGLNIPIIMNAPFGHGDNLYPITVGRAAHLAVERDTRITLSMQA